ncbi:HesA/MoeB/ThiF family protein [Devosia rhodophyticola]|uniref:HesA/MoeB/ThiF family protein n=1 Tax=Devosia rhodophyticola TaxID=3026423 RepID=A0ABY7YZZ2_9HYPH|nr:HesA/MoeB/ThiF family protein [Devosia rhodophyticola]WDR06921.1 HesA/MoeB/ThiF family protein [Devosia rhodophyticola]
MNFTPEETSRYARHLVLKGMGGHGQQALKGASVLVIGAGGLGSPALAYLAAAGVGTLGIVDDDRVAISNLQRQIVHTTAAVGAPKAQSGADFASALNPHVKAIAHQMRLDAANADALLAQYGLVLDGSDNFATRAIVAAAAERARIPLVSGAVSGFDGQISVIAPHILRPDGSAYPAFADLYPESPDDADLPSCELNGVLGPLTGVIGSLMAMEAVKLITDIGTPLLGRLMLYNGRDGRTVELNY